MTRPLLLRIAARYGRASLALLIAGSIFAAGTGFGMQIGGRYVIAQVAERMHAMRLTTKAREAA